MGNQVQTMSVCGDVEPPLKRAFRRSCWHRRLQSRDDEGQTGLGGHASQRYQGRVSSGAWFQEDPWAERPWKI